MPLSSGPPVTTLVPPLPVPLPDPPRLMKQLTAVIRPHLAEDVLEALRLAPIEAMTVREVRGYGRQKSYLDQYRETEFSGAFVPKIELTVWVDDSRAEEVLEKIAVASRTGRIGDGKILVASAEAEIGKRQND